MEKDIKRAFKRIEPEVIQNAYDTWLNTLKVIVKSNGESLRDNTHFGIRRQRKKVLQQTTPQKGVVNSTRLRASRDRKRMLRMNTSPKKV